MVVGIKRYIYRYRSIRTIEQSIYIYMHVCMHVYTCMYVNSIHTRM